MFPCFVQGLRIVWFQAEVWLREQAQALGWSKATKLEGRQTSQGLIGVAVNKSHGVLVEVNCETDFVARNQEFRKIVETATKVCLNFSHSQARPQTKSVSRVRTTVTRSNYRLLFLPY